MTVRGLAGGASGRAVAANPTGRTVDGMTTRHDLKQLFRAIGRVTGGRALEAAPVDRKDQAAGTDVIDDDPARVAVPPVVADAYVDGIQAAMVLTHVAHRPVYLSFVSAGAVDGACRPLDVEETLKLVCSHLDRDYVESLRSTVPVHPLASELPPDVERSAHQQLGGDRADHETTVVQRALNRGGFVVVDGGLSARSESAAIGGVVKTDATKYLPDERVLYSLPAGWRSPRFKIPAGRGADVERWSCYVRLHPAEQHHWTFGLIRLETFSLDMLEPLAALTLTKRQFASSGDSRFDRHLQPVRRCEDFLRSRRPKVF